MDEQIPNNSGLGMDPTTLGEIGSPVEQLDALDASVANIEPEKKEEVGKNLPPEQKPKKQMSKGIFILLIVTLILGVAYGVYYFLSHGNSKDNRVKTKAVIVTLGDELSTNLEDYATFDGINPNNCVLDAKEVKVDQEGTYDYKIVCGDKIYPGKLEVKDLKDIEIVLKDVYKTKGEELKPEEFIESCNKELCEYTFVDEEEVLPLLEEYGGPYDVVIKITAGEKEAIVTGKLTVTETAIKAYLVCTSPSEKHATYNAEKVVADRLAIGEGNLFVNIATRIYKYTFESEEEYIKLKDELDGKEEFDKIVGKISYDDEKHQILVTVKLLKETLDIEYDAAFPKSYADIKNHYTDIQYGCSIEAV